MKNILFCVILLFKAQLILAQHAPVLQAETVAAAYNQNRPDELYRMMSTEMQSAISKTASDQLFAQLMSQLGEIKNITKVSAEIAEMQSYRLSFAQPVVDIMLMIQGSKIVGLRQVAKEIPPENSLQSKSPDNYGIREGEKRIYATLQLPHSAKAVPVVLLIAGSGSTDRNMNQGNALLTNSFSMLADTLAAHGIATVRYDKRGVGKSIAALENKLPTMDDYGSDAAAFIKELKDDKRFSKVFVIGHSEGSGIAIIAAKKTPPFAFISLNGYDSDLLTVLRRQLETVLDQNDLKLAKTIVDSLHHDKFYRGEISPSLNSIFNLPAQQYLMTARHHQAKDEIKQLSMPILIIGGTSDLQISTEQVTNLSKSCPDAQLSIIQGMNHVLKDAPISREENLKTYQSPQLKINTELGNTIVRFIHKFP